MKKYFLLAGTILISGLVLLSGQFTGHSERLNEIPSLNLHGESEEEWRLNGLFVDHEFQLNKELSIFKNTSILKKIYVPGQTKESKVYLIGSGTYKEAYHDQVTGVVSYSENKVPVFIIYHEDIWQYPRGGSFSKDEENNKIKSNGLTIISINGDIISSTAISAEHFYYTGEPILQLPNSVSRE